MRPTKERVDEALTLAARHPSRAVNTLAAEVRALRATLARVETALDECAQTEGADEAYVYVYAIRDALTRGEP